MKRTLNISMSVMSACADPQNLHNSFDALFSCFNGLMSKWQKVISKFCVSLEGFSQHTNSIEFLSLDIREHAVFKHVFKHVFVLLFLPFSVCFQLK